MIVVGDPAPRLILDSTGGPVPLADLWSSGPIVLVFVAEPGTPLCDNVFELFAAELATFVDAGATVFGVSRDPLPAIELPVLFDTDLVLSNAIGIVDPDTKRPNRAVAVIGQDGKLRHLNRLFNPANSDAFLAVFESVASPSL